MAGNIPGLNEQMMRQIMRQRGGRSQAPVKTPSAGLAEDEYMNYKRMATPAMKKMMWPSLALSLITDPSISGTLASGIGKIAPSAGKFLGASGSNLGALGALGYLGPKVISEGLKSRRHAYEKTQPRMGGMAGNTLKGLELASSIDYLMRLPGWASVLGGMKTGTLLGKSPRIANWLTGSAKNVMTGKGSAAVEGGGILSSLYSGLKGGADKLTRGQISSAMSSAIKKGGIGGAAASGAGLLDKGISGLLGSPMGIMMGMAGLQVGLSIYKSVKMAKLTPTRQTPDKYARNFYNPAQTNTSLTKILTMNPAARDPQAMGFVLQQKTFMVQQLVVQELMRLNMQVAGFRGEYHTENDFVRQEKEKGENSFGERYGSEVYGEDDRGVIMRGLDRLSHTITKAKNTFDPFTQLTNFAFGLLRGKMILPGTEVSKIAKIYGFDDENKMMKERSESFGTAMDQTRLLHTPGRSVLEMAQTYESKMMALGVAQFDLNRYMLAELMTIRLSGYGIDQNILHRKEPGVFKQFMSDMFEKLNPLNLPGVNALFNLTKGIVKGIGNIPTIASKMFQGARRGIAGGISWLGGESYTSMRDDKELRKASGLEKDYSTRANEFMAVGLPAIQAEMKQIQVEQLESLQNLVEIQMQALELSGGGHAYQTIKNKQGLLVWDSDMQRWLPPAELEKAKKGRQTKMAGVKENAFTEGPAGKLLFMIDAIFNPTKAAGFGRGKARQRKFEDVIGGIEEYILGQRKTVRTSDQVRAAEMSLTSLQPTTAILESTPESEDARRQFAYELTKKAQEILGGAGAIGGVAVGALFASLPLAALLSIGASVGYIYTRFKQRKAVSQITKKTQGYVTEQEQLLALFTTAKRSVTDQIGDHNIGGLGEGGRMIGPMQQSPAQQTNEHLAKIQSYLGASDTNNVFTLLKPGTKDIAEVTIVDKQRKPIFIGGETSKSQMGTLYHIQDYLGKGKDKNIFTSLQPGGEAAEVGLHEATVYQLSDAIGKSVAAVVGRGRAKGGPVGKDKPVLVGEEGPEILMPRSAGVVIPNDKIDKFAEGGAIGKFDVFGKILDTLKDNLWINQEALTLDIHESKKAEEDAKTMTFMEKMNALKEKMKETKDQKWQDQVVTLLGLLKSGKSKDKDGKKEEGGIFSTIWDFIKGNGGKIIGGILATVLGGLLLKYVDVGSLLKNVGGFLFDQIKSMAPGGRIGTFTIAGAAMGMVGGPLFMLKGALIGALVGGVVSSIFEFMDTQKTKGIGEAITQLFAGDKEGGIMSSIKTMGPHALAGGTIGMFLGAGVLSLPGFIAGAAIGAAVGGIVGYIGQWGFGNFATDMSNGLAELVAEGNNTVVNWFSGPNQKYGGAFAEAGFIIPFFGPLLGGIIGSFLDAIVLLWSGVSRMPEIASRWIKSGFKAILPNTIYNKLFGASDEIDKKEDIEINKADVAELQRAADSKKLRQDALDQQAAQNSNERTARDARQNGKPATPAGAPGGPSPAVAAQATNNAISQSTPGANGKVVTASQVTTGGSAANIDKLAPPVADNFTPMADEFFKLTGRKIKVNSVFRTIEEQRKLYAERPGFAAPPGQSLHGLNGMAYAIDAQSKDIDELERLGLLKKYGFVRPMAKEPWHMQPIGINRTDLEKNDKGIASGGSIAATSGGTDFMGTVSTSFGNIGKLLTDAATKDFSDTGIKRGFSDKGLLKEADVQAIGSPIGQEINVGVAKDVIAETKKAEKQVETVAAQETAAEENKLGLESKKRFDAKYKAIADTNRKIINDRREKAFTAAQANTSAQVQRGTNGTIIGPCDSYIDNSMNSCTPNIINAFVDHPRSIPINYVSL